MYRLSRSKYLFHHWFQTQDVELIEQHWFFQFYIVGNQIGLIYPLYKYIPVPCSLT